LKEKGSKAGNALITFFVTYIKKTSIDLVEFIKESTEFMGEPKNSDGTIINMSVKKIETTHNGLPDGIRFEEECCKPDELDQFIHFKFHGTTFCVDRKNMTAQCNKKPKIDEMTGEKNDDFWILNVETSN